MLDSGANVLAVPWKPGMKGEKTMCTLVGDNKTEGLIISRLYTHSGPIRGPSYSGREGSTCTSSDFIFSENCELSSFLEACPR